MKPRKDSTKDTTKLVKWGGCQSAYYEIEDSRHHYLYDALIAASGVTPDVTAFDYGCGSGDFLARWLASRVRHAAGYDNDAEGVAIARSQCRELTNIDLFDHLSDVRKDFDLAFFNAVWMTLPTEEECIRSLCEVRDHVRDGGRLVAAVTHPCFRDCASSKRRTSFRREDYMESGTSFFVSLRDLRSDQTISFSDYHWTLADLSRHLKAAEWKNMELFEVPVDNSPAVQSTDAADALPIWLIVTAEKGHGPTS